MKCGRKMGASTGRRALTTLRNGRRSTGNPTAPSVPKELRTSGARYGIKTAREITAGKARRRRLPTRIAWAIAHRGLGPFEGLSAVALAGERKAAAVVQVCSPLVRLAVVLS